TAREPINRPDTYERFPKSCQFLDCEQQPAHTNGPEATPRLSTRNVCFLDFASTSCLTGHGPIADIRFLLNDRLLPA
ncbi:hypothetical protein, partial [Hoeflea halophila]|uniref:hypothetical protein n=1 Tax=Hoeflea halophila TaxID=714899 RepID=UPI001AEF9D70